MLWATKEMSFKSLLKLSPGINKPFTQTTPHSHRKP